MSNFVKKIGVVVANIMLPALLLSAGLGAIGDVPVSGASLDPKEALGDEAGDKDYDLTEIAGLIQTVANWMIFLAVAISVIFIIWGAFIWMTGWGAKGQDSQEEGMKRIRNAVIGLVVALLAFVIARVVVTLVGNLGEEASS